MKKAAIIYNPVAGSNKSTDIHNKLKSKIKDDFDEVISLPTEKPGDGIKFAKEKSEEGYHSIFVIGGDGTVNEVVNGIMKADVDTTPILGVLPGGTFNGVSRILEMPQFSNLSVRKLDLTKTELMDVGKLNDTYFNMIYSIGDVPESLHSVTKEEKAAFSMFAYAFNIARDVVKNSHYQLRFKINDEVIEGEFSHVVVILSSALSKLTIIDSNIEKNDGLFHIFILKESSFFEKFGIIPDLISGRIKYNEMIKYISATELYIESDEENVVTDLDGDKSDSLPSRLKIIPKAIEMYSLDV